MKGPIPPIHEPPEEPKHPLSPEHEAQKHQRVQALYLHQTQQARTRHRVVHLLGVNRDTAGRWLDAYALGGMARMLAVASAPSKPAFMSSAMQQGLRERLAQPQGFARF